MKTILALTFCLLSACASPPPGPGDGIVGEWRYADKIQSCHYVFSRDGSFNGDVIYRGKAISKFTGRWAISGDVLQYTYTADALGRIPAGATDKDKLLSVKKEFFVIQAADGSRRQYDRIP